MHCCKRITGIIVVIARDEHDLFRWAQAAQPGRGFDHFTFQAYMYQVTGQQHQVRLMRIYRFGQLLENLRAMNMAPLVAPGEVTRSPLATQARETQAVQAAQMRVSYMNQAHDFLPAMIRLTIIDSPE